MTTPALQNFMVARAGKTYGETVLVDTPVGYWKCDDSFAASTLADSSGNARNLTLSGTRALGAKAKNSRLGNAVAWTASSGFAFIAAAAWHQITGNCSVEAWIHLETQPTSGNRVMVLAVGASGETLATNTLIFFAYRNNGGTLQLWSNHESGSGVDTDVTFNVTLSLREWHHLVMTRDVATNTIEFWIDGVMVSSQSYVTDPAGGTTARLEVNANGSAAAGTTNAQGCHYALYNAKLANARIQEHYRAGARSSPTSWANTVFMCNFIGADAAVAVADSSSFGRVMTFSGNAQLDTGQAPPGCSSSLLLDGTGDFVSVPDHPDFEIVGQQFTIEAFVRMNAGGKLETISNKRDASSAEEHSFAVDASNILTFNAFNGGSAIVTLTDPGALSTGTWYHVAAQRIAGNVWTLHRNGVLVDSDTSASSATTNAQGWTIGRDNFNTARDWDGWIGPVRFTMGESRYPASNFTAPSAPFLPYT